jgi:hypothetical protein
MMMSPEGPGPDPINWWLSAACLLIGVALLWGAIRSLIRSILAEPEYGTVGYDHETEQSVDRRREW